MGANRVRRSHTHFTGGTAQAFDECDDLPKQWYERTDVRDETEKVGDDCPLTVSAEPQKIG
jgi:hypothetical protein